MILPGQGATSSGSEHSFIPYIYAFCTLGYSAGLQSIQYQKLQGEEDSKA